MVTDALRGPSEPLDPEQEAAARAGDGGVLVMAGAGTGKTRTLVARVAHLVADRGVEPSQVVVATFTNKAAGEIRSRVAATVGPEAAAELVTGTFHSLGARMLRRHHAAAGLTARFVVVDDDDAKRVLRSVMGPEATGVDAAFSSIRRWKAWNLTAAAVRDPRRVPRPPEQEALARLYLAYQEELRRRDVADFADLVSLPTAVMYGDDDIRTVEAFSVRHLLVDEAQDANPAQVMFTRLLSSEHRNVFAVGDEDQSIYSFQGGYPSAIRHIAGFGAAEYTLFRNRRCTDEILAHAVRVVSWNDRRSDKELVSGRAGEPPVLSVVGNEREEGMRVAARVGELLRGGASPGEVAVLARSAYALSHVEEAMVRTSVPHALVGSVPFHGREEIRDVVAYLRLAVDPRHVPSFERIANKPTRGLGPAALARLVRVREVSDKGFDEVCRTTGSLDGEPLTPAQRAGLGSLAGCLAGLARMYEVSATSREMLEAVLAADGVGYEAVVRALDPPQRRRKLEALASLRRMADEEEDVVSLLQAVLLSGEDVDEGADRVRLSTVHSSKGLEWDHVVCVGFDSSVTPSPRALDETGTGRAGDPWDGPSGGGVQEERRLVHVAFTRARHTLDVFAPLSRNGKPVDPSFFLPESGLDPYAGGAAFMGGSKATGKRRVTRTGRTGFGPSRK